MKPNLKTNQGAFAISILHILLFIIIRIRTLNHFGFGSSLSYWLDILADLTFLIPIIYIVVLLKFVGEKKYIINYFSIFAVIEGLSSILFHLPQAYTSNNVLLIVGVIISLTFIGIIIISFNIKNSILRFPFRGLAIAYILLLVINWGIPLLVPLMISYENYSSVTRYISYTRILPGLGLAYIIYCAEALFKNQGLDKLY